MLRIFYCYIPRWQIRSWPCSGHSDRRLLSENYKTICKPMQSLSSTHTHTGTGQSCSVRWQRAEQLCLINGLICRLFCSVLFSFNKVLLCYCYRRRENMKKHGKLLRHSTLLTNHTSYCCVCAPLLLGECVHATVCLCVGLVLLSSWGSFGRLAGANVGKLASDWQSRGLADGLSLKKRSPFRSSLSLIPC